ncbi:alpha/beta hydrolase [Gilliamella sp. B3464]|uniref:alpha/beta fold hydrolase n=1 Tax=unclassified Gilliamella TaxID=2685620 RepID=UPI00226A8416|nr:MULTISPECIES: alpha/beta hydrolase [unclassified Gilliamella]MCX8711770.1 alpha/beta hydrolase [Gilliamella sp. B3468]MCX8750820.1 alpha/beta hydrolase [Gilliamella sp. B3464]
MLCVNGVNLYYLKTGKGEPLMLLHGNGEDHQVFLPLIAKLTSHYTIYAVDSRNHGRSDKTAVYDYNVMADDIEALINKLHLKSVNIIGFSDGAIIALLLALRGKEMIKKMALLGVNLKPSDFTQQSYQYVLQHYEQTNDPLFKMMLEQPNIEVSSLTKITIPTLIIGAENDIYNPAMFVEVADNIPNSQLKIMTNHDHGSYIINNDMLYPDLVKFFEID